MFSNKLEFKGVVIGMILGDASIPKIQRGVNASLSITHGIKQEAYLMHKKKLLSLLTECRVSYGTSKCSNGKKYSNIRLDTKTHPFYTKLREHFYYEGRKTIDEHVLKCLSINGLALWYQDDGCLIDHEGFLTPFLCTHGFNKVEVELISRFLQKKFGLQWRLRKDKQYYALRLRRYDRTNFFNLIAPFVHDSMKYKIRSDGKETVNGPRTILKCAHCKKEFEVPFRWRERKYCSCKCYHDSRSEKREESQE